MAFSREIDSFINDFVKDLTEGNVAIFAGAGMSQSQGFINWAELLREIADDLELSIDKEYDLISIAQYHTNENAGRARLNRKILEEYSDLPEPHENHKILIRLPITTFWTTNYDKLIEDALKRGNKVPDVKHEVKQLANTKPKRDAVVYKMHGDVEHPADAILTKDQYEAYYRTHEPFITVLSGDLISKTFLFIGFSFTDPNLNLILGRLNIQFGENSRQHYCFFKKETRAKDEKEENFHYKQRKQTLMINDLRRYKIKALLIDDYSDITKILAEIERRYKKTTSNNAADLMEPVSSYQEKKIAQPKPESGSESAADLSSKSREEKTTPRVSNLFGRNSILAIISIGIILALSLAFWQKTSQQTIGAIHIIPRVEKTSVTENPASISDQNYDAESGFPTGKAAQGETFASIGFTVFRARQATERDKIDAARETIDTQETVSERIEEYVAYGDLIYLQIESLTDGFLTDKGGYLYVINREKYADGSFDKTRLIFPTLGTYQGVNLIKPGQPIILPGANRPFCIGKLVSLSAEKQKCVKPDISKPQFAETYIIIISPQPLNLPEPIGERAMVLPDNLIAEWERNYGEPMFRATLRGGVGMTRTKREQTAGNRSTIDTAEPLTQSDPLPQTVYRGTVKTGNPALIQIELKFKN